MNIDPKHRQRLNAAYADFQRQTRGLSDRVLHLRLIALANKGPGETDPFLTALARRELEAREARSTVAGAQEELQQLRRIPDGVHYPGQPDKKAQLALRKDQLEQDIAGQTARLVSIAQDPMLKAREEAIAVYREQEAAAEKLRAVRELADAKQAAAEAAELDAAAERVLKGRGRGD